jgi:hypothetical protein
VLELIGDAAEIPDPTRFMWAQVGRDDPDVAPLSHRLLRAVAERVRWRKAMDDAKARADGALDNSATARGRAA